MRYAKEDILNIWKECFRINIPNDNSLSDLSSSNFKFAHGTKCPRCGLYANIFVKVDNAWACCKCHKRNIAGKGRLVSIFKLTNDMLEYFGEVTSQKLFDSTSVSSFVKFFDLESRKDEYVMFLTFLRRVLAKEIGALSILDFLNEAESAINKKSDGQSNKEDKIKEVDVSLPG